MRRREGGSAGGGKKGTKLEYQRVIPRFLQGYAELLTGGGAAAAARADKEGAPAAAEEDDGYDEAEIALLEAARAKAEAKKVDVGTVRERMGALARSIAAGEAGGGEGATEQQQEGEGGQPERQKRKRADAGEQEEGEKSDQEPEKDASHYIDASGKPVFNKPKAGSTSSANKEKTAKPPPRVKPRKANPSLLSFGAEDDS